MNRALRIQLAVIEEDERGLKLVGSPYEKLALPSRFSLGKWDLIPGQVVVIEGIDHNTNAYNSRTGVVFLEVRPMNREDLLWPFGFNFRSFCGHLPSIYDLVYSFLPPELKRFYDQFERHESRSLMAWLWVYTNPESELLINWFSQPTLLRSRIWGHASEKPSGEVWLSENFRMVPCADGEKYIAVTNKQLADGRSLRDISQPVLEEWLAIKLSEHNRQFGSCAKCVVQQRLVLSRHPLWVAWQELEEGLQQQIASRIPHFHSDYSWPNDDPLVFFGALDSIWHGRKSHWRKGSLLNKSIEAFGNSPRPPALVTSTEPFLAI